MPALICEGLVIVSALYGKFNDSFEAGEECADVTVPLQNLVHESQLYLVGSHSKVWRRLGPF